MTNTQSVETDLSRQITELFSELGAVSNQEPAAFQAALDEEVVKNLVQPTVIVLAANIQENGYVDDTSGELSPELRDQLGLLGMLEGYGTVLELFGNEAVHAKIFELVKKVKDLAVASRQQK